MMKSYNYSQGFISNFNNMIDTISSMSDMIKNILKNNSVFNNTDYGICNSCYKIRVITPENISSYIDALTSIAKRSQGSSEMRHINNSENDMNAITVAMIKNFVSDNGGVPFEATTYNSGKWINPTQVRPIDLLLSYDNDVCAQCCYSNWELKKRITEKTFIDDIKKMKNVYFAATVKHIVDNLPDIIHEIMIDAVLNNNEYAQNVIGLRVEQFILFASALYIKSLESILCYIAPCDDYSNKNLTDTIEAKRIAHNFNNRIDFNKIPSAITEYAMLKTNDIIQDNNVPCIFNMRNVVLNDTSPTFEDTKAALSFITSDPRSPVSLLLLKFGKSDIHNNNMKMIDQMFSHIFERYDSIQQGYMSHGYMQKMGPCCGDTDESIANGIIHFDTNNTSWLDTLAYGNNYLNGNYRNDSVGNNHKDNITEIFDFIYKMFSSKELTTNVELSQNILQVAESMKLLTSYNKSNNSNMTNMQLIKDVLCVLGEIMTRNMIKLYHNNSTTLSVDDHMSDTMIPASMYTEGFVMEADDQSKPSVSFANGTDTANPSVIKKVVNKIGDIIKAFIKWVQTQVATFSAKFNEDHKKELEWFNKNTQLNAKIKADISAGTFLPKLTNFPIYKVPASNLKVDIQSVINKWLNSTDVIDPIKVKADLYPGGPGVATMIANMKTNEEQMSAVSNYILFSRVTPAPSYNGSITAIIWQDICDNISGASRLIETECKSITDSLKQALPNLQTKINEAQPKPVTPNTPNNNTNTNNNTDNSEEGVPADNRAEQLFNILQDVSKNYYVATLNVFRSKFYKNNYTIYRAIVTGYQQQTTKATEQSNGQNTNNAKTENNADAGALQTPDAASNGGNK